MPDLVTFGDSLPWGQGLLPAQKFPELVAQRLGLRHRMCAHSGARVLFHDDDGDEIAPPEVPFPSPTVLRQVAEYAGDPLEARVVLINGGVNDIKVTTLISPLTSPRSLQNKIRRFCYEDMAVLLQAVLRKFPHPDTRVVLTSYYPFFSPATDFAQLACFLTTFFILLPMDTDEDKQGERNFILQRIVDNAQLFWTESTAMFRRVVAESGSPRVGFALVPFGDENAMFAADPWLFNVYWTGAGIHAEDPVAACRRADCDRFHDTAIERGLCYIASAGHPNVRGSSAYASAILALLDHWPF
jgi:hypothetical protein